jgi:hypothetical protein
MWHTGPKANGGDMLPSNIVIGALAILGTFLLATGVNGENTLGNLIVGGTCIALALVIYRRSMPSE